MQFLKYLLIHSIIYLVFLKKNMDVSKVWREYLFTGIPNGGVDRGQFAFLLGISRSGKETAVQSARSVRD